MKIALPCFLLIFSVFSGFGQVRDSLSGGADTLRIAELPEVSVSAYRLETSWLEVPMAVTTIGEKRLQRGQQLTLTESLAAVPGVFVQNTENFAQDLRVSIRGFGARSAFGIRGIKVLQDGFPESTPDGSGQVDNIDPGMLRSVEVLRGAASGLYGNAAGGAIDFRTLRFSDEKFWQLGTRQGSYGFQKYQVETGGGNPDKVLYHLMGSYTGYDGYREHSESKNWLFNGGVLIPFDSTFLLKVVVNYVNSPLANDPGSVNEETARMSPRDAHPFNVVQDVGEHVKQGRVGFQLTRRLNTNSKLSLKGYYTGRSFGNKLPTSQVDLERAFTGLQANYEHRRQLFNLPWSFQTGFELEDQSDDRRRYGNEEGERQQQTEDQTEEFTTAGAYFIQKLQFGKLVHLHGGLRYDLNRLQLSDRFVPMGNTDKRVYHSVNPIAGVTLTFTPEINFYLNYATAFETPTLNELDLPGEDQFNDEIEPQRAKSVEAGLKGRIQKTRLSYGLATYRITTDNEITPRQELAGTFYENTGATTRTGYEFSLMSTPVESLLLDLSYTWSNFVFDEVFPNNRIPGNPEHLLYFGLGYQPDTGINASVQTSYTGRQFADNENKVTPHTWWLMHLQAGYTLQSGPLRISFFAGVKNALDQFYYSNIRVNAFGQRYFEPAPGRYFYGGIALRMNNG